MYFSNQNISKIRIFDNLDFWQSGFWILAFWRLWRHSFFFSYCQSCKLNGNLGIQVFLKFRIFPGKSVFFANISSFTLNMIGKLQLTYKINRNAPFLKQTFGQIAREIKHILVPEAVEVMWHRWNENQVIKHKSWTLGTMQLTLSFEQNHNCWSYQGFQ
jgi:hypothetical protein